MLNLLKKQLFFATAVIIGTASVARADVYMSMFNSANTAAINIANTTGLNAALKNSVKKRGTNVSRRIVGSSRSRQSLTYNPSSSLSQQLKERFWAQIKANNPQAATEIDTELKYQDVIGQFNQDVAPYGLRANNVGDSFTAYWVVMWMIVNREGIPPVQKVKAAQTQISDVILNDPSISQGSDTQKQTISETLIYETMLALGMYNEYKTARTPAEFQTLAEQAHTNMLRRGIDMRSMQLTSSGFMSY